MPKKTGTEFLDLVSEKDAEPIITIMDELMTTLQVVQPRIYDSVIRKINA